MQNTIPEPHEHSTQIALLHRDVKSINEKIDSLTTLMQQSHYHDKMLHAQGLEIARLSKAEEDKETRIKALESWRWYVLGIVFAIGFALSGIPWKIVFSN